MQKRWSMKSKDRSLLIEQSFSIEGLHCLQALCRVDRRFGGSRIREVFQAYPNQVPIGEIVETT